MANIALPYMYPVTCIDVIESAAVSSLGSSNDSVCVRYFEFLVLLLLLTYSHIDKKEWAFSKLCRNSEVMV